MKRWQDWVNLLLGAWTVASPWALGFVGDHNVAAVSAWVLGTAVLVFAAIAVYVPKAWEEAINIVLGIGLIASPWALGFSAQEEAIANATVVGVLVSAFALWAMLMDTTIRERLRQQAK